MRVKDNDEEIVSFNLIIYL